MILFKCYKVLHQWRYFAEHRPPYIFSFLQYHFSSLVAQVCRDEPMSKELLPSSNAEFDSHLYAGLLQQCIKNDEPAKGKIIHCHALKRGNCLDLFARNILLNFYLKTGLLTDGIKLFDEMPDRNVVSFVTMVQGFAQLEEYDQAVDLFFRLRKEGHELNPFVFTTILKLLVSMDWVELGWCIHACIHKLGHDTNAFVGTALIDAYSVCGFVTAAKEVFKGIIEKDMVCWTGMVACYAENDCFEEALDLFNLMRMEEASAVTVIGLVILKRGSRTYNRFLIFTARKSKGLQKSSLNCPLDRLSTAFVCSCPYLDISIYGWCPCSRLSEKIGNLQQQATRGSDTLENSSDVARGFPWIAFSKNTTVSHVPTI
ncbi:putative pentatricopeptide repeat-containing protein, mitochondrial [Sesamum alatum]|uniref:Pentatricopeptide repeat-containing protein, mitochondrial n=1 Tax=Sesamum alatum TaxID=300844 RepID=A0AAE1XKU5_9LAMI|nr:putative pentatricopeptide repeat-containing protein, mitochondrial [Sesamum alatum]